MSSIEIWISHVIRLPWNFSQFFRTETICGNFISAVRSVERQEQIWSSLSHRLLHCAAGVVHSRLQIIYKCCICLCKVSAQKFLDKMASSATQIWLTIRRDWCICIDLGNKNNFSCSSYSSHILTWSSLYVVGSRVSLCQNRHTNESTQNTQSTKINRFESTIVWLVKSHVILISTLLRYRCSTHQSRRVDCIRLISNFCITYRMTQNACTTQIWIDKTSIKILGVFQLAECANNKNFIVQTSAFSIRLDIKSTTKLKTIHEQTSNDKQIQHTRQ